MDYVVEQLTDAGWEVEVQEFKFPEYPGELEQLTPPVGRLVHRRRGPQDRGAAVLTYAYSTEDVNGVPGRTVPGRFTIPAPAGPEGTFQES